MILRELFAKLGLQVDDSGFTKADALIGGLKAGLVALGGLVVGAATGLGAMVKHTSEVADHLDETAQAAGTTAETLQELGYAASFSGMGADEVAHGLTILARTMRAAKDGSEETAKAFAKTGVSIVNADGSMRNADDVLMDLADHFGDMKDGSEKTALAMQLFGKSGAGMIPFLNAGGEEIQKMREEAHELGLVLSDDTIKAGAALDDTITKVEASMKGLQFAISGPLLPAVNELAQGLLKWINANRELIRVRVEKVVEIVKVGITGLTFALKVLWGILGFVIDYWKYFALVMTSVVLAALTLNLGALAALAAGYIKTGAIAVATGLRTAAAWALAELPLVALTVVFLLLILLIQDVYKWMTGGKSIMGLWFKDMDPQAVIDNWKKKFTDFLKNWLPKSFSEAGKDIWNGIKIAFGMESDRQGKERNYKTALEGGVDDTGEFAFATNERGPDGNFIVLHGQAAREAKERHDESMRAWARFNESGYNDNPTASFGSGSSPEASAAANQSNAPMVFAPSAQITVNPPPGTSAAEVAARTRDELDQYHQDRLDEANSALSH